MAKTIEQVIGENVKRLRERRGLSQAELGEEVGMLLGTKWIPQTVSAAERGKRQFIAAEMVVLADVLGCRVQYLFDPAEMTSIKVSEAFTFSPDFSSTLESRGVTDEQLIRAYSKLRLTLMGVPNIAAAMKEEVARFESVARHASFLLDFEDEADEPEGSSDA